MPEHKDQKQSKKQRKKALGLAAATAAAAAIPTAEVVIQKTEIPQPVTSKPQIEVPEPARYEYSKPRPLRTIGDLIKGVFGIGPARAAWDAGQLPSQTNLPRLPIIPYQPEANMPGLINNVSVTKPADLAPPPANPPGAISTNISVKPAELAQPPTNLPGSINYVPLAKPAEPAQPPTTPPGALTRPPQTPAVTLTDNLSIIVPTSQHPEAVVSAAKNALRNMLNLTEEQTGNVHVVRVEAVQWGDSSLGLPDADLMYAQIITPGYRITFQYSGEFFVYHTDESGSRVKLASQTTADPGPLPPMQPTQPTSSIPGAFNTISVVKPAVPPPPPANPPGAINQNISVKPAEPAPPPTTPPGAIK